MTHCTAVRPVRTISELRAKPMGSQSTRNCRSDAASLPSFRRAGEEGMAQGFSSTSLPAGRSSGGVPHHQWCVNSCSRLQHCYIQVCRVVWGSGRDDTSLAHQAARTPPVTSMRCSGWAETACPSEASPFGGARGQLQIHASYRGSFSSVLVKRFDRRAGSRYCPVPQRGLNQGPTVRFSSVGAGWLRPAVPACVSEPGQPRVEEAVDAIWQICSQHLRVVRSTSWCWMKSDWRSPLAIPEQTLWRLCSSARRR